MKKQIPSIILAILVSLSLASGASAAGLTGDSSVSAEEWDVLRRTDQYRMGKGMAPLTTSDDMQKAANQRAGELTGSFAHDRPDGRRFRTVFDDYGISNSIASENIAYGYTSAAAVMEGWLSSTGHRENIERSGHAHLGVGCASGDQLYWAQDFAGDSCSYTDMRLSTDSVSTTGQDLEDILKRADVTVYLTCSKHGACKMPLIAAMCSGFDPDASGMQTVTVQVFGFTAVLSLPSICREHVFDEGTVQIPPTCTKEGIRLRTCTLCGRQTTEAIPMKEHDLDILGVCRACRQQIGSTRRMVTFDPNEGTLTDSKTIMTDEKGILPRMPSDPVRLGWKFAGWKAQRYSSETVGPDFVFTYPRTVYAQWSPLPRITFDANGGTLQGDAKAAADEAGKLPVFPKDPARPGYTFDGWYTSASGGVKATASTTFTASNTTLYAHWTRTAEPAATKAGQTVQRGFSDVRPSDHFAEPVKWAVARGITNGTSATTFSPYEKCSTAHILTFLWRAYGSPEPKIADPYIDVSGSEYYAKAALWAYEKGMIGRTAFRGDAPCTRAQSVTYQWIAAGRPAAAPSSFSDVDAGAEYAAAVAWAVSKGVTTGTSASTFSPKDICTRGQIVTFLYRDLGGR